MGWRGRIALAGAYVLGQCSLPATTAFVPPASYRIPATSLHADGTSIADNEWWSNLIASNPKEWASTSKTTLDQLQGKVLSGQEISNPSKIEDGGFASLQQWVTDLKNQISSLEYVPDSLASLSTQFEQMISQLRDMNLDQLTQSLGSIDDLLAQVQQVLQAAILQNAWHTEAIALFGVGSALLLFLQSPDDFSQAPYAAGTTTYDPIQAAVFYQQRPWMVVKRILKLAFLTGRFNAGLLWDWLVLGKLLRDEEYKALKRNEPQRAKQALILCQQLGPTFIKLGQALSIRTDLIPEAYALELRQLQDAVPPFDSKVAYELLAKELGVADLRQVFESLSAEPVASASIGQVYKGILAKDGTEVAVKVQRPGILAEIALDLHVLRVLTPIQTQLQNLANGRATAPEDIATSVALVDEWGRGFVAETDYRLEAANTQTFAAAMKERGLDGAICAPPVVQDLVRDTVLVTEWVDGTRLDRDASPDVPRLCGVAINAYLTMLLDTGVLHCDPHPGNLLRTKDGKLCILDWGMTLEVPKNLQYALLELIAHINIEDYESIPQDFINLGFSPQGVTADKLKSSGITEGLTFAFRQLSQGGGPKKIQERVKAEFQERYGNDLSDNELRLAARAEMLQRMEAQLESEGVDVQGVTNVMEEMSRRNRELFQLPPYVLYVARAFSTLEGIGLSIDENYAIIQECYPYLARRLFTDRSPRAKRALRAMLGLPEEANHDIGMAKTYQHETKAGGLSTSKLVEMSSGFATYTQATSAMTEATNDKRSDNSEATETAALALLELLISPKGSTLQDILVEETARLGDAATRKALQLGPARLFSQIISAQHQVAKAASPLLPKPLQEMVVDRPAALIQSLNDILELPPEDERLLESIQQVAQQLQKQQQQGATANIQPTQLLEVLRRPSVQEFLVRQGPAGASQLTRKLGASLLERAAQRTDATKQIPQETRDALVQLNRRLAKVLQGEGETATSTRTSPNGNTSQQGRGRRPSILSSSDV